MKKRDPLLEKVRMDFPGDPALQQVHYSRLRIQKATRGMTSEQFLRYIKTKAKRCLRQAAAR